MKILRPLFLLSASLIACMVWTACKTSHRPTESEVKSVPTLSYAVYAQDRVKQSYENFIVELNKVSAKAASKDLDPLLDALAAFTEMLDIFVHVMPMQEDFDFYVKLQEDHAAGIAAITSLRAAKATEVARVEALRATVDLWLKSRKDAAFLKTMDDYLESMNKISATRRTITVLENTCWGNVDFIPNLKGPYDKELGDFMKALIKAFKTAAASGKAIKDILSSTENKPFYDTRIKIDAILTIAEYFPEVFDTDTSLQSLLPLMRQASLRYDKVNEALLSRDLSAKAKKSAEVKTKGEIIKADWQNILQWEAANGFL